SVLPHLRELSRTGLVKLPPLLRSRLLRSSLLGGLLLLLRGLLRGGALGLLHGGSALAPGRLAVTLADAAMLVEVPHAGPGDGSETGTERGGGVEGVKAVDDVDGGGGEGAGPGDEPVVPLRAPVGDRGSSADEGNESDHLDEHGGDEQVPGVGVPEGCHLDRQGNRGAQTVEAHGDVAPPLAGLLDGFGLLRFGLLLLLGQPGGLVAGALGFVAAPLVFGDPRLRRGLLLGGLALGAVVGEALLAGVFLSLDADGVGFSFGTLEGGFLLRLGSDPALFSFGPGLGADRFGLRLGNKVAVRLCCGRFAAGLGLVGGVGGGGGSYGLPVPPDLRGRRPRVAVHLRRTGSHDGRFLSAGGCGQMWCPGPDPIRRPHGVDAGAGPSAAALLVLASGLLRVDAPVVVAATGAARA